MKTTLEGVTIVVGDRTVYVEDKPVVQAGVDSSGNPVPLLVSTSGAPAGVSGAATAPVSRVTSTDAAATLFIARPTRRGVLVRNTDTANSVWIGPATVTSANGFLLKAGESLPLTFTGLYQVIDNGADHAVLHVLDEYD